MQSNMLFSSYKTCVSYLHLYFDLVSPFVYRYRIVFLWIFFLLGLVFARDYTESSKYNRLEKAKSK